MPALLYIVLVSCFVLFISCTDQNATCTTPNGDQALCIPIHSCDVIQNAILTLDDSALEFARNSQCGYSDTPMVCCGTTGVPISIISPPRNPLLPEPNECGGENVSDRIQGGEVTELDEFPWMALLEYQYGDGTSAGFKCGGSLISERYVVTAAHCIITSGIKLFSVRLGEWQISTVEDCNAGLANRECNDPVVNVNITNALAHPKYNRRSGDYDVGLLRLERNIKFTGNVKPICLPNYYSPVQAVGTVMTVAGWGSNENSYQSDRKLKLTVPIVAQSTCKAIFANRGSVTDNQICAGGVQGRDACQGDSGGPLMAILTNEKTDFRQWYLEGVVASGVGCARKGVPGIYTRVAKFVMWILSSMEA